MAPFTPVLKGNRLEYHAVSRANGLPSRFLLALDDSDGKTHRYSLEMSISWSPLAPHHHDYYRKSAGNWFDLWTQGLTSATPHVMSQTPTPAAYQSVVKAAMEADAVNKDIPSIQRKIITALQAGASFRRAHKEGGTNIRVENGVYVRQDYGESSLRETFGEEAAFLAFLRKFYDAETSYSVAPARVSDETAWRLILTSLDPA